MDLISREKALADDGLAEFHRYDDYSKMREYLKSLPSAFEGMTYGEVIANIIPNLQVVNATDGAIEVANIEFSIMVSRKVWDSPYKEVSK